jgi:hypothetical protein
MESGRTMREWLERLDPVEFREVSSMISEVQLERAAARQEKLEQRRSAAREKSRNRRYLRLERVKCGKKSCKRCAAGELHGPYWYLYRPKHNGEGRTSEYVGKTLPQSLAKEFDIPEDPGTAD